MFKRMFQVSSTPNDMHHNEITLSNRNGAALHPSGLVELSSALQREAERSSSGCTAKTMGVEPVLESFEEVYTRAGIKPAGRSYTILKVGEMLNSKHLVDMSTESKRNSLMMALEAAGAEIGELLQDANARNRALEEYEEDRLQRIKAFEVLKAEENNRLHAELERLTSQYMSLIQSNSDQMAQEQDNFRGWKSGKQQEAQRIADAVSFCVPQGSSSGGAISLSAALERVNVRGR